MAIILKMDIDNLTCSITAIIEYIDHDILRILRSYTQCGGIRHIESMQGSRKCDTTRIHNSRFTGAELVIHVTGIVDIPFTPCRVGISSPQLLLLSLLIA